jgi:3-dehydro-L-gulonate 2-dehydrogenase
VTGKISLGELRRTLERVLLEEGFEEERAGSCALLFAEASRDGVHSHGLNRFPRFVRMIRNGCVDPRARAERVGGAAAMERWDGRRGPGNLNAQECMGRAIELAREHGIGCVALGNTNHWMRAGSYGWQAAEAGMIGICWTNTMPNLPQWGSVLPLLGNNPLVIAVPREGGHVVLDMAMSQFSYGALEGYAARGESLPVAGGFGADGALTTDAAAVLESGRPLPIGYWKGSGLALLLDLVAATLAGGSATHQLSPQPELETDLSQTFIAFAPGAAGGDGTGTIAEEVVRALQRADGGARYPGERVLDERRRSLAEGVTVDPDVWRWVSGPREAREQPPG